MIRGRVLWLRGRSWLCLVEWPRQPRLYLPDDFYEVRRD